MYNNNEKWSYFVSDILIYLGKSLKIISLFPQNLSVQRRPFFVLALGPSQDAWTPFWLKARLQLMQYLQFHDDFALKSKYHNFLWFNSYIACGFRKLIFGLYFVLCILDCKMWRTLVIQRKTLTKLPRSGSIQKMQEQSRIIQINCSLSVLDILLQVSNDPFARRCRSEGDNLQLDIYTTYTSDQQRMQRLSYTIW